ncbi:MAG: hypothetical protein GWO41_14905 [candidate division Zixibacteria bacterium]|nr:hypothetical protein [candidate division Zixibacteria bacterium]NIR64868.1 hypothetical protein [candidate division Zixibacteria bacterium]NIS17663.1 hypothetical protein [candidate division Zixibacteria bacterium]NIS46684.1 hypothetical protein [candidate division Zixibacteria bacterium]NIT53981.1 hypothetical protein [candidate division Zixibacteria bacterium]
MNTFERQHGGSGIKTAVILFLMAFCFGPVTLQGASYTIFNMQDFSSQELRMQAFTLNDDSELEIDIIGARHKDSDQMYALGWILDSETREVVWSMSEEATRRLEDDRKLRRYNGTMYLDEGDYEAYYFAGNPLQMLTGFRLKGDIEGLGDLLGIMGDALDDEFSKDGTIYYKQMKKFKFQLSSEDRDFIVRGDAPPVLPDQVISLVRPRNLSDERAGFTVTAPTDVKLYAIGEYSENNDVFMDGAKIINARTRQKVWAMERWNTDWSGGAFKNRCFLDEINLQPGDYIVNYWTDESHTFDDWNSIPPYDPFFYGITISAASPRYADRVKPSDIDERKKTIVQITKVTDDVNLARDFKLKRDMRVNVYAIGEGRKGYMYDYGWIKNADNDETVWIMREDQTDHAGGAAKNRVYDGILELKSGNYTLRYKTDGSHSYGSWNAAQPSDSRNYGITLYAYEEDFSPDLVEVGQLKSLGGPRETQTTYEFRFHVPPAPDPQQIRELVEQQKEITRIYMEQLSDLRREMRESPNDLETVEELKRDIEELKKEYEEDMKELTHEFDREQIEFENKELENQMRLLQKELESLDHKNFIEVQPSSESSDFIVRIGGVGNNANLKTTFKLDQPTRVRIHALGEGVNGRMYDYGWITDKKSGNVIWEMTYMKTQHAGGAVKNRLFDGVIMLDKGTYEVYYVSDDSHSYAEWNDYAPPNPTNWGISLKFEK